MMDSAKRADLNSDKEKKQANDPALLNCILASGPEIHVVLNTATLSIDFTSPQFYPYFNYTPEDLLDPQFSLRLLLDDFQVERLRSQIQTAFDDPGARNKYVYYKLFDKGRNTKSAYIYLSPFGDKNVNSDKCLLMILPDMSKWTFPFISSDTRNLYLEQSENEDRGTFEWMVDTDRVYWSDGIYEIYEVDKNNKNIDQKFTSQFIHPEDADTGTDAMADLLNGKSVDMEYRIITDSKKVKVIHSLGKMIFTQDGKPFKLVGSIHDITKHRSIEGTLKKHVDELNRSNKELEEFAYVASHDLQEPLRKISTFSDRLSEKYANELTAEGSMYLQRIMASAENMRILINNLLEFSRITKSTQPFAPTNLNFILHQVKTELELIIEETGSIIQSDNLPTIVASMTQMKQLFTNIINNSIKFRKPYVRPIINIEASALSNKEKNSRELSQNITYHKIQITDNGIGFESEYATKIFQVFQRLHGKSEYPGSGIGLAICKKIVEHHHGQIYAENIPGCGARFTIILPDEQAGS